MYEFINTTRNQNSVFFRDFFLLKKIKEPKGPLI